MPKKQNLFIARMAQLVTRQNLENRQTNVNEFETANHRYNALVL
jgi:hypothetical protein